MKKVIIIGGVGIVLLVVVAVVALAGGIFRVSPVAAQDSEPGGERIMILAVEETVNGETFSGEVQVTFKESSDLPSTPADAGGLYLGREGDTLSLGTGAIEVTADIKVVNGESSSSVNASHDGETITVKVGPDTVYYMDTTGRPDITPADIEAGSLVIISTVAPGKLMDLTENMLVRVWGQERGGVLMADVLVYEAIR